MIWSQANCCVQTHWFSFITSQNGQSSPILQRSLELSDYPRNHCLADGVDKTKRLTIKGELNGSVLQDFTCLRSKL